MTEDTISFLKRENKHRVEWLLSSSGFFAVQSEWYIDKITGQA